MNQAKPTNAAAPRAKREKPAWYPKRMTEAEYSEFSDSHGGLCLACGELAWGDCEPDARRYPCDDCGRPRVYGAEEARLMGAISVSEDE